MDSVIALYKPCGYTPLQLINEFKATHSAYKDIPMGYAGRLDPQAEGVVVILVGKENNNRKIYEKYDKKYKFEVLFGITTDTYDIMGIITDFCTKNVNISLSLLSPLIQKYIGQWNQPYPPYSSPRVNGKPLFYWARKNALDTIEIPKKTVHVQDINLISTHHIDSKKLLQIIETRIKLVKGDFRQEEIIKEWKNRLEHLQHQFIIAQLEIACGSGLYVRSLAYNLGKQLETPALAFSIIRTAVGPYTIENALHVTDTS